MTPTRLVFDDIRPDDFDALHAIVSCWDVVRMLESWPWPPDPDFTQARARPYEGEGFIQAIRSGGRLVGTIGIVQGSLGYMIAPEAWGRGIATASVRAAAGRAILDDGLDLVTADARVDNPASVRVLEKNGFEEVGSGSLLVPARGETIASRRFELDRDRLSLQGDGPSSIAPHRKGGA